MSIRLDGETRLYAVIGDPIAQVKSPSLLTLRFAARGINGIVIPVHVAPADIPAWMAGAAIVRNLDGVIATVPHKTVMLPYCSEITDRARYAGSANVLWRKGESWHGDNTDGMGYIDGILAEGGEITNRRMLLVGAGGAGSAIAYEALARGASHLAIHDVDRARRDRLLQVLGELFPGKVSAGSNDPSGFDVIGNATPLGMRAGDPLPVEAKRLNSSQFVADVVTRPEISPLIEYARSVGCKTMPGLGMFQAQQELLVDALLGADQRK
ncbi:shikimate dehydrogenase family protein [Sedimenticola sp.]|uniref:shikimate dehydrogenase family protein n=1 Tax=Sedimenticola sp. TaxID=1940285 RepID=UPI003D0BD997